MEIILPYWLSNEMAAPSYRLRRLNHGGARWYEKDGTFYLSVTSLIAKYLPTPYALIHWRGDVGNAEADRIARETADYGTFFHIQAAKILRGEKIPIDALPKLIAEFLASIGASYSADDFLEKAINDLFALVAFIDERDVKPLAIEMPLISEVDLIGGTLDLYCEMTFNKKRVAAIVDFKTGRKGFYDAHAYQLALLKRLWNENYPQKPVECVFNFAPKEWRKERPTFDLKEQTDNILEADLLDYLQIHKRHYAAERPLTWRCYAPIIGVGEPYVAIFESYE